MDSLWPAYPVIQKWILKMPRFLDTFNFWNAMLNQKTQECGVYGIPWIATWRINYSAIKISFPPIFHNLGQKNVGIWSIKNVDFAPFYIETEFKIGNLQENLRFILKIKKKTLAIIFEVSAESEGTNTLEKVLSVVDWIVDKIIVQYICQFTLVYRGEDTTIRLLYQTG